MSTSELKSGKIMADMSTAFLSWKRHLQKSILPYQITLKQFFVLKQLLKKQVLYPAEVAAMLYCDRPTASVILRNMEKKGWIQTEPDPENRKRKRISITTEGEAKRHSIPESVTSTGIPGFDPLSVLSSREVETLKKLMSKVGHHCRQFVDKQS